jgi:hypothetical protein
MRAVILALVSGVALAATSVQAAPAPTKALPSELGDMRAEPLVADDPERLTLRQADQMPTRTPL